MSTQWFRRYELTVTPKDGEGVSINNLSDAPGLRLKFEVIKSLQKEPNHSTFDIYNLGDKTANSIQHEYTDLSFSAGYEGHVKLLFVGNTQFVSYYHDKADTICEVICGDGDQEFREVFISKTFAKGTTDAAIVEYCRTQMGLDKGTVQLNAPGSLRGRSYAMSAHKTLDEIARTNGCSWSIQNGALHVIRADSMSNYNTQTGENQAIVLNAGTGLLQAAERTARGIKAICLLNPDIAVNTAIHLDNAAIRTQFPKGPKNSAKASAKAAAPPVATNKDGIYKVFKVKHSGDTRSTEWQTEIMCVGLGQPIPTTSVGKGGAVPVGGGEE